MRGHALHTRGSRSDRQMAAFGHRVTAVGHEIDEHLLELIGSTTTHSGSGARWTLNDTGSPISRRSIDS